MKKYSYISALLLGHSLGMIPRLLVNKEYFKNINVKLKFVMIRSVLCLCPNLF